MSEWLSVAYSDPEANYEWDGFDVKYSGGEYFWTQQSGCSCDSLYDYTDDRSNYQKGMKSDVYKAITQWGGGNCGDITDSIRLMKSVFAWSPPELLNKPMIEEEIKNDEGRVQGVCSQGD